MAVAQPCLTCRKPTTNGARCGICEPEYRRAREAKRNRPTAKQRGYDATYRANRRATIAAQPWCDECGSPFKLTADHIVQPRHGGDSSRENLRTLCSTCNSRRGGQQNR